MTQIVTRFPDGLRAPQQWLDGILARAPGATPDLIKHELLTTIRDFCQRGWAWVRWLDPVNTTVGLSRFALEPQVTDDDPDHNADAIVSEVLAAVYAATGQPLVPRSRAQSLDVSWLNGPGRSAFSTFQPGIVELFPTPTSVQAIRFLVVLVPNSLDVPDWLVLENFDAICSGVLSRIHMMPGDLKDAALGIYHRKLYLKGRAEARVRARTAWSGADQAWLYPPFGA